MNGDDFLPPAGEEDNGEESEDGGAEVLQFPGLSDSGAEEFDSDAYSTEELAALSGDPVPTPSLPTASELDDFTEEHYVQSTTRDYQGLAQSIAEASGEELKQSAVAAAMPGVEQGVIGFGDMTGEQDATEAEQLQQIEKAQRSDLLLRVGTGLALVILFFGALYAGAVWITIFLTLLLLVAVNEFYQAVRSVGYSPVSLFGLLGLAGVMVGGWISGPFSSAGVVAGVVLAASLWFSVVPRRYPLANIAITVMGVAWIGMLPSLAIPIFQAGDALALVTALVALTALNDIGAYFTGRAIGSRQLAPALSPKKTVEGFAGGLVICVLVGAGMGSLAFFQPLTVQSGVALAAVVSIFGPIGDLAESTVKRLLGVKDMGSILPGHGGVLDRLDAFLFTIPAAYLLFRWFGYL